MQYKTPFLPIMPGSAVATYLDLDSAAKAIVKGRTAAVFVEPIQGEGGVTPANTCVPLSAKTLFPGVHIFKKGRSPASSVAVGRHRGWEMDDDA